MKKNLIFFSPHSLKSAEGRYAWDRQTKNSLENLQKKFIFSEYQSTTLFALHCQFLFLILSQVRETVCS